MNLIYGRIVLNEKHTIMKLKSLIIAAAGIVGLSLSSCSTFSLVNSEVYNNSNLAAFHTFHIITPEEGSLPPGMELVTYYNIAAAIREQMIERGYTESAQSPLVINIGLTVHKEIATAPLSFVAPAYPGPIGPFPPGAGWFPYNGPAPIPPYAPYFMMPRQYYYNPNAQVITGIYREGVLTMDMVDMQTKTAVFSSSVATILENGDSQFRNLSGIAQAVQTLFKKFPVPLLPQYRNQK